MKSSGFGSKPSRTHVVWTDGPSGANKRFDGSLLKQWCEKFDFDFDVYRRADHDRGDGARKQYRCVFSWQTDAGDTIEFGGTEWTLETDRIPRTFVEIDGDGMMRVRGWEIDRILDVRDAIAYVDRNDLGAVNSDVEQKTL